MASNTKSFVTPLFRHVATRSYAQSAPAPNIVSKISSRILPNKTAVVAFDNGSAVTRVTVAFKAGSRYEPNTELGISHVLRSAAGLTTSKASTFLIARKLAQIGASVTASGDREFVYYTLETTRDNVDEAAAVLTDLISCQEFRPWELSDNVPRLQFDIAALPPQVRAVDLLHRAAYRRGLGNSLFISPKRIGKISSESLQHYVSNYVATASCAVAVVGNTQERAAMIAQNLTISTNTAERSEASTYYGGELRKEMGGDLAHVALALKGAPAGSPQSLALAVAAKALGNGPLVKWGSDNSPLSKAIGNIGPFAAAGFNVSYSDNGLFGVILSVPKDETNCAVKAVAKVLKSSLSEGAIKTGKAQLKVQILSEADAGTSLAESLAAQSLYTGSVKTPADIAKDIDSISANDVAKALSAAAGSKFTMAAVGNLAFVPFIDEL